MAEFIPKYTVRKSILLFFFYKSTHAVIGLVTVVYCADKPQLESEKISLAFGSEATAFCMCFQHPKWLIMPANPLKSMFYCFTNLEAYM